MKETDNSNESAHIEALRRVFVSAFAFPAALSVLSEIDERLSLLMGLIEKGLTNFTRLAEKVWADISLALEIDLTGYADKLTFYSITIVPILISALTSSDQEARKPKAEKMFENYLKIFGWIGLLLSLYLFNAIAGIGALFLVAAGEGKQGIVNGVLDIRRLYRNMLAKRKVASILIFAVNISLAVAVLYHLVFQVLLAQFIEDPVFMATSIISLCIYFLAINHCLKHFGYIALWVLGILYVHWIATTAIPAVDEYLKFLDA